MQYKQVVDYLFTQFSSFQRVGGSAYKAGLETSHALDSHFNHPHHKFKSIHVAGTNGKGSVSHMLASILMEAGYRVGLYTSPHLKDFRERIRIDGQMIPQDEVVTFVEENQQILSKLKPSFFEITVAMAFQYFAKQGVDVAVIEVGLGGRLDSTNIITPKLSIITSIAIDHTTYLGNTLDAIAKEKAGIIKAGVPVVVSQLQPEIEYVFINQAKAANAPISFASKRFRVVLQKQLTNHQQEIVIDDTSENLVQPYQLDLGGEYQAKNLLGVLEAVRILNNLGFNIKSNHTKQGLRSVKMTTGLLGRWQVLNNNPLTICDTGHNAEGIREILAQIKGTLHIHLHMVIGMVGDKDVEGVLNLLPKDATYYFAKADIPRALSAEELAKIAQKHQLQGYAYPSVAYALKAAQKAASTYDLIFIGGSTFIVAEVV